MLTAEQNELLTRVGPGTPCGDMMRRYWHPVAAVSNGQKRWDADKLGAIMATDIFGTRNTGLRLGG